MQRLHLVWFDRKFINDVAWSYGSLGVVALSGLVLNVAIARYYGPKTLGVFGQVVVWLTIAAQVARICSRHSSLLTYCLGKFLTAQRRLHLGPIPGDGACCHSSRYGLVA